MQIVIDIPEEIYSHTQEYEVGGFNRENDTKLFMAIKNGTPLPKSHGRLIAEPTGEEIAKTIGGKNDFADCIREAVKAVFANAHTIIEADGGDAE